RTGMPGEVVRCGCVGGGSGVLAGEMYAGEPAAAAPIAVSCVCSRRLTLNRLPHCVHLTVTPCSPTLESSNSYTVMHFSQRTSIERLGLLLYHPRPLFRTTNRPKCVKVRKISGCPPVDFVDLGPYRRSESRESAP